MIFGVICHGYSVERLRERITLDYMLFYFAKHSESWLRDSVCYLLRFQYLDIEWGGYEKVSVVKH